MVSTVIPSMRLFQLKYVKLYDRFYGCCPIFHIQISTKFVAMVKKSISSKKLSFAHSFKPVYILCRIFGFMPFSIAYDSNGEIQTARIRVVDLIWFIISIGVYLSSAFYFVIFVWCLPIPNKQATLIYGTRLIVLFRKLFNCLCIVIGYYFIPSKLMDICRSTG